MIFFYSIAVSVCISIALFNTITLRSTGYLDFITKDAYCLYIAQSDTEQSFKNSDFKKFIVSNDISHIVKTSSMSSGIEIYWNSNCHKNITVRHGRIFSNTDIQNGEKVALISRDLEGDCVVENDKYFYMFDNGIHEVIGVMETTNIDIILPLMSVLNQFPEESINGTYYLDCGERTLEIVQSLKDIIMNHNNNALIKYEKIADSTTNESTFVDLKSVFIIACGVVFLMLMNIHNILLHWFNGKKSEISAYKLCGIHQTDIWYALIVNYSMVVLLSSVLGLITALVVLFYLDIVSTVLLVEVLCQTLSLTFVIALIGIVFCSFKLRAELKD